MEQFKIEAQDHISLNGYHFFSVEAPKAVMVIVHGMGEHAYRYVHVAHFFNQHGVAVLAFDHRGHGKSEGKRGHTASYDLLMNDLDRFRQKAAELYPNLPILFYAHSMGGNLTLNYLIRNKPEIAGAIITGPYLRLAFNPPKWKVLLGKLSAKIVPTLTQPTGLDASAISSDKQVVANYKNDPLVHDKISSSFFVNVHFAGPYAIEHANKIEVPHLVMHGLSDQLTSANGTKEFEKNSNAKATFRYWEGLYHELHNEPAQNEVFQFELEWLKNQGLL
ncbi:MAG: lysophospholipase [Bacteroidota bacterium]